MNWNNNNANDWATTAGGVELMHPRGGGGGGGALSAAAAAELFSDAEQLPPVEPRKEKKSQRGGGSGGGSGGTSVASTVATVNSNDDGSIETDYVRHMDLMARSSSRDDDDDDDENDGDANNLRDEQKEHHPHIAKELCLFLKNRSWKKKLMTLVVILSVSPVILDIFVFRSGHLQDTFDDYLEWMSEHPLFGPFSYICMLVLTSLIFIPPSILIFAAGFTFSALYGSRVGIVVALVSSYIGSTMGGAIGFVRARYMTRDLIEILIRRYPMIRAVDAAIVRNSLRVMILLRLNCLIPFGVLNYVFGITGVPWEAFVLGMVGIIPWHLFLICLGASSATFVDTNGRGGGGDDGDDDDGIELLRLILSAMGVAFGFIGLAITWKFAKKELQKVSVVSSSVVRRKKGYFLMYVVYLALLPRKGTMFLILSFQKRFHHFYHYVF
jgi:uncharacterized membrane protein YdjX (TVP38/TMEM64 family)